MIPKSIREHLGVGRGTAQFEIIDKDTVTLALGDYAKGKSDFAGYYIGRANERAGAEVTLIFDKTLRSDPRFRLLKR